MDLKSDEKRAGRKLREYYITELLNPQGVDTQKRLNEMRAELHSRLSQPLIPLACGIVGWPRAHAIRLPAPQLIGPMLASGGVYITGLAAAPPPSEIVNLAQLVMGTIMFRWV